MIFGSAMMAVDKELTCKFKRFRAFLRAPGLVCYRRVTILAILLLVIRFGLPDAFAGDFQVRSWYAEDGLPNNTVNALAQSRDGNLWIGTPKGLVRFDGNSFKSIGAVAHAGTLEDSNVVGLAVDHSGNLWIAGASGAITEFSSGELLVRFRPAKTAPNDMRFTGLRYVSQDSTAANWRNLNSLFATDAEGAIWATTIAGDVIRFNGADGPMKWPLTRFPGGPVLGLANDDAGRVWMLKGTNACVYESGRWTFTTTNGLPYMSKMLCLAPSGGFWTTRKNSERAVANLTRKHGDIWDLLSTPIPTDPLGYPDSAMLQDRQGRLWLAAPTEGIYEKPSNGDWSRVQAAGPLAKCVVRCLFEDERGSIWVGTDEEGLHQVLDPLVQMVMLPPDATDVHLTTVCAADNGDIWMGTDKGLYRQKAGRAGFVNEVPQFHRQNVYTMLEDSQTNLWIGTKNGIYRQTAAERGNANFETILNLGGGGNLALYEDQKRDIWAGGFQGKIFHFHDGTNDFVCKPPGRNTLAICCLTEDAPGHVLAISRWDGLWQARGKELVKVDSVNPQTDTGSQMNAIGRVCAVLSDSDHVLWIGTFGNGLFRWYNGRLDQFTVADGLPDNGILGLKEDDEGNLWLSSRNGIYGCSRRRLNNYVRNQSAPLVCMQLGLNEGMADRECTGAGQPVIARGPDGRFWVATTVGAAGFFPATVTKVVSTPQVTIENFDVDGHTVGGSNARIPASARHFEFQYSAPELTAPQKLHFRYWLEGLDQTWTDAGVSRVAVYNKLPAGDYRFRVMVGGEDGVWHEAQNTISLRVVPHFWQTLWFQALAAAGTVALISGGVVMNIRRKMRRSLERMETQQAVEQVRQRITRDLHDELGSAITEIIQIGDLSLQPEPGEEMLRLKMKVIMNLIRHLSITVDEIVWTMSSRHDTLPSLVGYISNHAQEFFRYSNISCRLDVSKTLPAVMVNSQTRHNLFLATKEALNNVAKHSRATEVILRAHYTEQMLRVSIEDNGQGFDADSDRAGEGLANMRERLQALGGETTFTSGPGCNTAVTFTLDLTQALALQTQANG
jgi:ligand-binding sensor domain-containing protein/signal transduction histidine kinase